MTAIPHDAPGAERPQLARTRALPRLRALELGWELAAFAGVTTLAAVAYLWNLAVSGYANTYYAAAALAASKSWSAFFFGSFDAANFITVDKPPASVWLMGLSVRIFGLSSWSVLLPQALCGILTVALLFVAVRRSFGTLAATVAGLVMAVTPAAVLIFRFNNPDALLTLLLVAAAYGLLRSLDRGSLRWTAAAAACVGFAFLTKYLQAYLVLPGFALVYLFAADASLRRRVLGLGLALATVLATSGWWVAIVELIPAGSRPFIGGSTTGSVLDLIFGYDGLGRIFGNAGPGGGAAGAGAGFGGEAGPFRLFNDQFFGQVAWFIPLAIAGLALGLWLRRQAPRTDRRLAGYLLWGSWFVVTAAVFSYMSGIVHSYYAVALAPAVAALAGAAVAELWHLRGRSVAAAALLGGGLLAVAAWGAWLLARTPDFAPLVAPVAVALAGVAAAGLVTAVAVRHRAMGERLARVALAAGLVATLMAPGAYALATVGTAYGGGDPHPGPGAASTQGGFGGVPGGPGGGAAAGLGGFGGVPGGGPTTGSGAGGFGAGGASADSALVAYLVANRGTATWIVAADGSMSAGPIELASGLPVMAMGGFTGSDPTPTLAQLKSAIAAGQLRFVLVGSQGGFGGPGGGTTSSERTAWVTSACTIVSIDGSTSSGLYDCAGAS